MGLIRSKLLVYCIVLMMSLVVFAGIPTNAEAAGWYVNTDSPDGHLVQGEDVTFTFSFGGSITLTKFELYTSAGKRIVYPYNVNVRHHSYTWENYPYGDDEWWWVKVWKKGLVNDYVYYAKSLTSYFIHDRPLVLTETHCGSTWTNHNSPNFEFFGEMYTIEQILHLGYTDLKNEYYGCYYQGYLDNRKSGHWAGFDSKESYHVTLEDGRHTFFVREYWYKDVYRGIWGGPSYWVYQGNYYLWIEDSNTIDVYIDTTPPPTPKIFSFTHPTTRWGPNKAVIKWSTSSGDSPDTYYYNLDNLGWQYTDSKYKEFLDLGDGHHTIQVYAVDVGGTSGTNTYNFRVDSTPPSGSILINDGDGLTDSTEVALSLAYSDSLSGVWVVRYSNDGTFDSEPWETPTGAKSWTLTAGEGTKTVWYQVKDNAFNTFVTSDTIYYDPNQPPVADANGPYEGDEGALIILDSSGSYDPDGDPITYLWDLDNDGVYDDATPNPGHAWYDDGTYNVVLQVSDGKETDTDTATITINDVAPTLGLTGPASVSEGSIYTLGLSSSDPGTDTITSWEIDWGDGNIETVTGNP
ncbi:MAG: PKD domain-containing protein, partial [Thermoplasmata archaeon]